MAAHYGWCLVGAFLILSCKDTPSDPATNYRVVEEKDVLVTAKDKGFANIEFQEVPETIAAGNPTVSLSLANSGDISDNATVDILVTQSSKYLYDAISIAGDLALGSTLEWDTSKLEGGTYYLVALLKHEKGNEVFRHSQPIYIEGAEGSENRAPFVKIVFPEPGKLYVARQNPYEIKWESIDLDGDSYGLTIEENCENAGWQLVAEGVNPLAGEYSWSTFEDREPSLCQLRILANDGETTSENEVGGHYGTSKVRVSFEADDTGGGQLKPLFEKYCASCHGGEAPIKNFNATLYESDGQFQGVKDRKGLILRYMNLPLDHKKRMPPASHTQPSESELKLFQLWHMGGVK